VDTLNIESLFVLGMTDSSSPQNEQTPSFDLPEPYQDIFKQSRLHEERQQFLKFLTCPKKEVIFSFPSQEGETPLTPSALLMEFKRITKQKFQKPETLPIFSNAEILENLNFDTDAENLLITETVSPDIINRFQRQLKILKTRNNQENFGIYEGNLSSEETIKSFLKQYYHERGFSVSGLENYAKCPMQFLFKRLLRINEPEEFEDWVTPREKGMLVHTVLFRFYSENSESQRTQETLKLIAEEEIEKLPFVPSALWDIYKESFLGNQEDKKTGLFQAFFEYESEQQKESPLMPIYFEVPFGRLDKRISADLPKEFNTPFLFKKNGDELKLKGIIDRVELGEKGGILIIDYKTGEYPRLNDIKEGQSLQLPLYLKVFSTLLKEVKGNSYPIGAGYYIIKGIRSSVLKKEIIFLENKHIGEDIDYNKSEKRV
jgi:ATP-dependent helicase/nuclease subunit B